MSHRIRWATRAGTALPGLPAVATATSPASVICHVPSQRSCFLPKAGGCPCSREPSLSSRAEAQRDTGVAGLSARAGSPSPARADNSKWRVACMSPHAAESYHLVPRKRSRHLQGPKPDQVQLSWSPTPSIGWHPHGMQSCCKHWGLHSNQMHKGEGFGGSSPNKDGGKHVPRKSPVGRPSSASRTSPSP